MKPSPTALKLLFVVASVGCALVSAQAQNIVADPGFEASADGVGAHPFSASWTAVDPSGNQPPGSPGSNTNVGGDGADAHSGANYANLGAFQTTGTLSQLLTTTAGTRYTFSFWLANNSNVPTNSFAAFFNGSLVFSTTSATFNSTGLYTKFTFANLLATGSSTLLQFQYRHDDDFWRLDDISVAAPEGGSTLWLALPAFAGLCFLHFRSNKRRHAARA
jgi:hypothetical protein